MTTHAAELWTAWVSSRDARAFEALVAPEMPHALSFARRLGCGAADAEDALQDALARLVAVRDDAPAVVGVRAWLCREVHVRARSRLRSERRRRTREAAAAVVESRPADASVGVRDEVGRALSELDDDERVAVELRHLHDFDYREMALVLGASEGACRQRVSKALARLRERLGRDAAALVAALPLPAARDVTALVRGAWTKAAATAAKGATTMAVSMKTIAAVAAVAAALGVAGTLGVQRATEVRAVAASKTTIAVVPGDTETGKRRARLADAQRRGFSARPADDAVADRASGSESGVVSTTTAVSLVKPAADAPRREGEATDVIDAVEVMKFGAPWQAALRQAADPARRDAAWASVKKALSGGDGVAVLAALQTICATPDAKVDRAGVRELILPLAEASSREVRLAAWAAMCGNGVEPSDVEKLRAQIADAPRKDRIELIHRLNWATKGALVGPNDAVVLDALSEPTDRWEVLMAVQKARLSDAVVAKVLEYARTGPEAAQHAQDFVLRQLPDKNRDVVLFLLDRAERGDATAVEKLDGTVRAGDVAEAVERLRRLADDGAKSDAVRAAARAAADRLAR